MARIVLGLICSSAFFLSFAMAEETSNPFQLTAEEQAWLKAHPVIRIGVDQHFQPYEFLNQKGQHLGISQEYIQILSEQLGIRFQVMPFDTWSEVMSAAKHKGIDVLSAVIKTPERSKFLNFTRPYTYFKAAIVAP